MSKLLVVIADDIFTNRLLLSEIIEDLGYSFIAVENGREAINALINNEVDVILMDIEMPVMNGLEATIFIREKLNEPKRSIPVVALTAHNPKILFND
jgi:CheY-like chemotaxis protein